MNWFLKTLHTYVKLPPEIAVDFNSGDDDLIRRAAKLASNTSDVTQWNGDARNGVQPMLSIIGGNENLDKYLPCRAMDITSLDASDWVYNRTLWDAFMKEIKDLHNTVSDNKLFEESLVYTCQKYLSCISINDTIKDISLYHHIKMTAAIATCLADNRKEIVLAGADFSGIQSFIYKLVSKNAAKNLKGRSFYLQLLIDSVIQKLSKDLNLDGWQMVYASGGKFYMLIPASKEDCFKKLGKGITEYIRKTHGLQIYLAIGTLKIVLEEGEPIGKNMSKVWQGLSEKLGAQKRQRFAGTLIKDSNKANGDKGFQDYFEPSEIGGVASRDVITNEEIEEDETIRHIDENGEQAIKMTTYEQIRLGVELRKNADYWVSSHSELSFIKDEKKFEPCGLGVYHYFLSETTVLEGLADNETVRILKFNDTNSYVNYNVTQGFVLYGGNRFPGITSDDLDQLTEKEKTENNYKIDDPRTFVMLASTCEPKRLGILRMDVDNLGQHFINGIIETERNFSRYIALSNSLDYFFQGYLNTIWNKDEYREDTMIIYSGGDDLFIIGRWDKAIEIADEIQAKFREYVCQNPVLTLSGGVFLSPPKYPVMNGAKIAGDAEKKAKEYTSKSGQEKDAFAFLGNAMGWTKEYKFVKKCKDDLVKWHEELGDKFPNGLLQRIIGYAQSEKRYNEDKTTSLRWTWLMMYDLSKMAQRYKKDDTDFHDFIEKIRINAYNKQAHNYNQSKLQLYAIAARWAELYVRNKS